MRDDHSLEGKFEQRLADIEAQNEVRFGSQLDQLRKELEEQFEAKLKQATSSSNNFDKKLDKVASSILHAVDQKFTQDCELKQKIFYKLDERLDKLETDLGKKTQELTNLLNSKILSTKTEINETYQELRFSCKVMIEELDNEDISKQKLQFLRLKYYNTKSANFII